MHSPSILRLGVVAAAIGLAGCAAFVPVPSPVPSVPPSQGTVPSASPSPTTPPGLTIAGTFGLRRGPVVRDANGCHGTGENADVGTGSAVVVLDSATGAELGTGMLLDDPSAGTGEGALRYLECWFRFVIEGVPEASGYDIEAPYFRVSYTRSELEQLNGRLRFAVGGPALEAPVIPGISVAAIELELAVDCARRTDFGQVQTLACEGARDGIPVAVRIDALTDGPVLRIQAVASEVDTPQGAAVAPGFLREVAALPWSGTDPVAAGAWVDAALAAGGSTDIGAAHLEIDGGWPAEARGIVITGSGDPLPSGDVPPPAPTDIAALARRGRTPALSQVRSSAWRRPCPAARHSDSILSRRRLWESVAT